MNAGPETWPGRRAARAAAPGGAHDQASDLPLVVLELLERLLLVDLLPTQALKLLALPGKNRAQIRLLGPFPSRERGDLEHGGVARRLAAGHLALEGLHPHEDLVVAPGDPLHRVLAVGEVAYAPGVHERDEEIRLAALADRPKARAGAPLRGPQRVRGLGELGGRARLPPSCAPELPLRPGEARPHRLETVVDHDDRALHRLGLGARPVDPRAEIPLLALDAAQASLQRPDGRGPVAAWRGARDGERRREREEHERPDPWHPRSLPVLGSPSPSRGASASVSAG